MSDYRTLEAWQKAHQFVLELYAATASYPSEERFGLTSQTRRAAISIPSNIAEGAGRDSDRDFARFVTIAIGSSNEVEYQLLLARDLGHLGRQAFDALSGNAAGIRSMLTRLRQSLSTD
jgi:four helix bundle protein